MSVRLIVLAAVVGVMAGLAAAGFLVTLEWATETRIEHPALLFGLPVAGLAIGWLYHRHGTTAAGGNDLLLDEIHEPKAWIPRRMAPLVYVGTIATHLFGGSGGREGTALQMSGSLADALHRVVGVTPTERRLLLVAAIAGGFSAVFGVPFGGLAFALEVQSLGRLRWHALIPAAVAAFVGNEVVHLLDVGHTPTPTIAVGAVGFALAAKVVLAAVAFGLTATVFAEAIHRVRALAARAIAWPPARPFAGGVAIVALSYLVGTRDYLGLSLPLLSDALAGGTGVVAGAFALKLLFTAVTLGSGFQGGEVTPLFVVGATLGATLGSLLDAPVPLLAALGFVAVFAGATNTPIACTIIGIELFGWEVAPWMAVACIVAWQVSGGSGIYSSQRRHRWGFGAVRRRARPNPA